MTEEEQQNPHTIIGQVVGGKYSVKRLLGEGGMGAVYEAHQKLGDTIRKVAIKTLHPHLSHDPKILTRFEREVGTVAALTHPNTIQVYDFGKTDDGTLYIAMEFVQGRSVADILEKDGPMQPDRVVKILEQVVGSLEEAHEAGIVHRDLKPDNVVLCDKAGQKDWVEVLDFGIAKRGSEADPNEQKLTQQGMVLGTPPYMSPEQFTGQPIDRRSDVYALGVMAYEMLSGRLPFAGNTAWEWATAHMTAQPISLDATPMGSHIPPAMKQAIMRALEKNRDIRFGTAREFMDAFKASLAPAAGGGTAVIQQQSPVRPKTEPGAPVSMDFGNPPPPAGQSIGQVPYVAGAPQHSHPPHPPLGGAHSPPVGAPPYVAGALPHPQHGTPAAGNLSYAAPPPPPRQSSGGGGKGVLIGVLGLVLVGCIGVGIWAVVKAGGGRNTTTATVSTGTTTTSTSTTSSGAPSTSEHVGDPLPTLANTSKIPVVVNTGGGGTPTVKKDAGGGGTVVVPTTTTPTATAPPTQTTPPPPPGDPNKPDCVAARAICARGQSPACRTLTDKCLGAGGAM